MQITIKQSSIKTLFFASIMMLCASLLLSLTATNSNTSASTQYLRQAIVDKQSSQQTPSPARVSSEKNTINIPDSLQKSSSAASRGVTPLALPDRTYVVSDTTSSRSPVIYGSIPTWCDDVAVLIFADTANFETSQGFYAFYSEAGQIVLETNYLSQYDGVWYLDLQANGLGLINGKYNVYVTSKCDYSNTYSDPLYGDIHYDALSIIPTTCNTSCTPIHRFYSTRSGAHFYTSSEPEKRSVMNNMPEYRYEGITAFGKVNQEPGLTPVHRFYNKKTGTHFYTAVQHEATNVNNTMYDTYRYEGIAYYAHTSPATGTIAMHRFYKFRQGVHFYTASQGEATTVNNTMQSTYRYEGIAYSVIANR